MFIYGADDTIFLPNDSQTYDNNILAKLGSSATIKISHIEVGNGHVVTSNGLANMVRFINGADTYDSSTEVAGGGKTDTGGGGKDTTDKSGGDDDYWCQTFGYCSDTSTKDTDTTTTTDDGSPSWYKTADDYTDAPAGSKILFGSMVSAMLFTALEYF